ncbi:MAG: TetR/AcrR family transcriptional regulator C-terminal domain-containing protein [Leucobacter sp.]
MSNDIAVSGRLDGAPRKSGRPTRPPLTEDAIAHEALVIIDELGWDACTMKLLASRLGVRTPSLYHHINGQRSIVDLVRTLVVSEIHNPLILDLPWDEAFEAFGVSYYRAFAKHPNTIQVLSTTPVRDDHTLEMYETFLKALVQHGWSTSMALEALLDVEHLALGFSYEWNAQDLMLDSAYIAEHGAPLLAEATRERTDQASSSESTFLTLLGRHIEMYRHEFAAS